MTIKAIMLDFYGTLVEEDGIYIDEIRKDILKNSTKSQTKDEIGTFWYARFLELCEYSFGHNFKRQREIELISLNETIDHFESSSDAVSLSQLLYSYWSKPTPFGNTFKFLDKLELPTCVVSNIDTCDINSALKHIDFDPTFVVTSESEKAYKPRPEMFERALDLLRVSPGEVIHVGDSYSSDIIGASNLGIPNIWINEKNRARNGSVVPTYEVEDIVEILPIIECLT